MLTYYVSKMISSKMKLEKKICGLSESDKSSTVGSITSEVRV